MEKQNKKVTTKEQFNALVEILEKNPQVAKGLKFAEGSNINKKSYGETWRDISQQLNSMGPPSRTSTEWQKVWNDLKLNVKRKLAHNKKESEGTGGGPNRMLYISPLEETVVKLLSLEKTVEHTGRTFGIQLPNERNEPGVPQQTGEIVVEMETSANADTHIFPTTSGASTSTPCTRTIRKQKDFRRDLLTEQTQYLKEIKNNLKENNKYTRRIYYLKEKKNKREEAEHKLKIEILELKKKKLEKELELSE